MIQTVTHIDRHTSTYTQTGRHTHRNRHSHTYRDRHIHSQLQTLAARQSHVLQANGTHENICMFVFCCPVLSSSLARLPHPPLQCHLAPLSWHTENGQRASRINHLPPRRANDVVVLRDRPSPALLLLLLASPCSSSTKRGR